MSTHDTPKRPRGVATGHSQKNSPSRPPAVPQLLAASAPTRAERALGDDAPDDAWAAITSTIDHIAPVSQRAPSQLAPVAPLEEAQDAEDALPNDAFVSQAHTLALPRDASLKSTLNVTSSTALTWTLARSQALDYAAVDRLSKGGHHYMPSDLRRLIDDPTHEDSTPHIAVSEFSAALLHYAHPAEPPHVNIAKRWTSLVDAEDGMEGASTVAQRIERWQDALRSLFYAYRHAHIPYFYLRLVSTVVLFGRVGPRADSSEAHNYLATNSLATESVAGTRLRVWFSRATTGLRELMSEYGVHYETKDGLTKDATPCLIVDGDKDVHALFNFVSGMAPRLSKATDVPTLICDWPFRWATMVAAIPQNARRTIVNVADSSYRYSIDIVGVFTPLQIARLHAALLVSQRADFAIHMQTELHSSRLNLHVDSESQNSDGPTPPLGASVVSRLQVSATDAKLSVFVRSAD